MVVILGLEFSLVCNLIGLYAQYYLYRQIVVQIYHLTTHILNSIWKVGNFIFYEKPILFSSVTPVYTSFVQQTSCTIHQSILN